MIKALNKLTGLGMPETQCIVKELLNCRQFGSLIELRNKALQTVSLPIFRGFPMFMHFRQIEALPTDLTDVGTEDSFLL